MRTTKITLGLCALLLLAGPVFSQNEEDRKVSVDIEVEENGETKTIKKEFILRDGQSLDEALKELGILDELGNIESDERLEIDIRRILEDAEKDIQLRFYNQDGNGMLFGDAGTKPQLGVHLDSNDDGACITKVVAGSAAEEAGLIIGDCITKVNKTDITNDGDLIEAIRSLEVGDDAKITYTRGNKKKTTSATLQEDQDSFSFMWKGDEMPSTWREKKRAMFFEGSSAFLGVRGDSSEEGLVVTQVIEGTAAEKAGLQEEDVIKSFNGQSVHNISELAEKIKELAPGDEVIMEVSRLGEQVTLVAALGEHEREGHGHHIQGKPYVFLFDSDDEDVEIDFDIDEDFDFDFNIKGMSEKEEAEFRAGMEELQESLEELREQMKEWKGDVREMRVIIQAEELSDDDIEVLERSGVENLDKELDVELGLFPNPSDGLFQLNFTPNSRGDLSVEVFDTRGNQVYLEKLIDVEGPYNGRIDLTSRASGNYYLVVSHNGQTLTRKLAKR